ncbi:e3 ubiquitin-protein ligase march8 [Fagus crenata]
MCFKPSTRGPTFLIKSFIEYIFIVINLCVTIRPNLPMHFLFYSFSTKHVPINQRWTNGSITGSLSYFKSLYSYLKKKKSLYSKIFYAHCKCVQRWCNEKGDTIYEICQQQFKLGYTAPPPLHYGGIPINFRGNWEISRRDLHNPKLIAMVATDCEFLHNDFYEFLAPTSRSLIYCRLVAIIFMVLLVLRHNLPIIISGAGEYSLTLSMLLILRTIGILLPIHVMVREFTAIQRRRHLQG